MVGLKKNQPELFHQMSAVVQALPVKYTTASREQEHGRSTARNYAGYALKGVKTAERWSHSKFASVVNVQRKTVELKTGKETAATSYYRSNQKGKEPELCQAVRGHWQVEVNNHLRDVTLAADALRTKKKR